MCEMERIWSHWGVHQLLYNIYITRLRILSVFCVDVRHGLFTSQLRALPPSSLAFANDVDKAYYNVLCVMDVTVATWHLLDQTYICHCNNFHFFLDLILKLNYIILNKCFW